MFLQGEDLVFGRFSTAASAKILDFLRQHGMIAAQLSRYSAIAHRPARAFGSTCRFGRRVVAAHGLGGFAGGIEVR